MPDDSTSAQKQSQRAHGDRISFERQLMRATGMTRQQVRTQLRSASEFLNQVLQRQQAPTLTSQPPTSRQVDQTRTTEQHAEPLLVSGRKSPGESIGLRAWNVIINGQRGTAGFASTPGNPDA